jgi:hypothetical protein
LTPAAAIECVWLLRQLLRQDAGEHFVELRAI